MIQFLDIPNTDKQILKKVFQLRVEARNDGGFITFEKYPDGWYDEMDNYAIQFGGFVGEELVCSLRVVLLDSIDKHPYYKAFKDNPIGAFIGEKCAYLSRASVKPGYQKRGYFEKIMNHSYKYCNLLGYNNFWGDANEIMATVHNKMGWKTIGAFNTNLIKWDLEPEGQSLIFLRSRLSIPY